MSDYLLKLRAWFIHFTTACGAIVTTFGYYAIAKQQLRLALILMLLTIIIDAIDGPLARIWKVKYYTPHYNGELLDYIVDFSSWVLLPAFYILSSDTFLPYPWNIIASCMIILSSCYQFCCMDLKSTTSNFKRWPSAWSLMIILLVVWQVSPMINFIVISICSFLSFIPISYPHPFQKRNLEKVQFFEKFVILVSGWLGVLFLILMCITVFLYPLADPLLNFMQQAILVGYAVLIVYWGYKNRHN